MCRSSKGPFTVNLLTGISIQFNAGSELLSFLNMQYQLHREQVTTIRVVNSSCFISVSFWISIEIITSTGLVGSSRMGLSEQVVVRPVDFVSVPGHGCGQEGGVLYQGYYVGELRVGT